ncbi:hypothetical protein GS491_26340 [Rhodococcus hoagii]|nr:hypothetical protein [Prescottella equi]NKR80642.1 hypothetical protein [Prescottella equi]NKS99426.1 hypothetical protein [Prescottella equi]
MTTKTAHELLIVHPDTLEIGDNVRDEVDLAETPEFVESITEHGVLHPVLAERREDGTIVVVDEDGQAHVQYWTWHHARQCHELEADWPVNLDDPNTTARTAWYLIAQVHCAIDLKR